MEKIHKVSDKLTAGNPLYSIIPITVLLGIVVGITTVFLVPVQFEIVVWLILIIGIGKACSRLFTESLFSKSFMLAALVGISITFTHLIFLDSYLDSHQEEMVTLDQIKIYDSYIATFLMIAPVYWLVLGSLSGACSLAFRRFGKV